MFVEGIDDVCGVCLVGRSTTVNRDEGANILKQNVVAFVAQYQAAAWRTTMLGSHKVSTTAPDRLYQSTTRGRDIGGR